jgi:hypothetical protein
MEKNAAHSAYAPLKNDTAVRSSQAGMLGSSEAPVKMGPFVLIGGNGD